MTKYIVTNYKDIMGNDCKYIQNNETGDIIPFSDGNRFYEEYKLWLEAGNTPDEIYLDPSVCEVKELP